jgi:hypothetical protein
MMKEFIGFGMSIIEITTTKKRSVRQSFQKRKCWVQGRAYEPATGDTPVISGFPGYNYI